MSDPLKPSVALLAKIGSILVHVEEDASPNGHPFDLVATHALLRDPEVQAWLDGMRGATFLPLKR